MYRVRFPSFTVPIVVASAIAIDAVSAEEEDPDALDTREASIDTPDTVELLQSAIRARVAVSFNRRSGTTIPAAHCRHAVQGCERRLAEFSTYLVDAADRQELDPWLVAAMAIRESGLNPFARGAVGELGILQINPSRRDAKQVRFVRDEWYRRRCRKQPGACQREVVEHAVALLARSIDTCEGDLVAALGLYNTGRCGGNDRYAKRVLEEREALRRSVGLDPPNDGTAPRS